MSYEEPTEWYFKRFQRFLNKRHPNIDAQLDCNNPGDGKKYQVTYDEGSRTLTAHLSAREMKIYLDGMVQMMLIEGDFKALASVGANQ